MAGLFTVKMLVKIIYSLSVFWYVYRLERPCVPSLASPSWFIKGAKGEDGKQKVSGSPNQGKIKKITSVNRQNKTDTLLKM